MKNFCIAIVLGFTSSSWAFGKTQDIEIKDAWVRAMPASAEMTAAYFAITNNTVAPLELVAVQSPIARECDIHETVQKGAFTTMKEVTTLEVSPKGTTTLGPGGYHVMMSGLREPLGDKKTVPLVLKFKDGREVKVEAAVKQE